tara:strand:- start:962 stop:1948 length:987 start_codon:yes stop_codon:yes gene_type:complete
MVSNSVDNIVIDCLQYANWSPKVFKQMREGNVDCVHVTIAYHENFRETVLNLEKWNTYFSKYSDLIVQAFNAEDIVKTKREKKTSIIFGFQNPSPIEDDIGLIEIWQKLGIKFMQLTYNNQSLLASGCYETNDAGISRMGKEVIKEMNRVGMVIDMSHSSERSTLEAIEHSSKPISITHANPSFWHPAKRNKSNTILKCLSESGGMLGLSLYPHHLKNGSMCELNDFCDMIVRTVDLIGIKNIGIGSDLCQDQPDTIVEWMRNGRWTKDTDFGEGSIENPGFPKQPNWFKDNRDFNNISKGLKKVGLSSENIKDLMGRNWLNFFKKSF